MNLDIKQQSTNNAVCESQLSNLAKRMTPI